MQTLALLLLLSLAASAQTFDVISVKPFKGGPPGFQGIQPGCKDGHFAAVTPVFLTMEWAYDMTPGQAGANSGFADPDVLTAVQQQLGLKLQESRGPVQHLIVESIEKTDEN